MVAVRHRQPATSSWAVLRWFLCVCVCMLLGVCHCLFWFFPPVGVLKTQIMQITPVTVRVG